MLCNTSNNTSNQPKSDSRPTSKRQRWILVAHEHIAQGSTPEASVRVLTQALQIETFVLRLAMRAGIAMMNDERRALPFIPSRPSIGDRKN
jgi:hypothetical protein